MDLSYIQTFLHVAEVGTLTKAAEDLQYAQSTVTSQIQALEKELAEIDAELFGSAASDYTRAAELDARKTEAEERLLEIYEIIGV